MDCYRKAIASRCHRRCAIVVARWILRRRETAFSWAKQASHSDHQGKLSVSVFLMECVVLKNINNVFYRNYAISKVGIN